MRRHEIPQERGERPAVAPRLHAVNIRVSPFRFGLFGGIGVLVAVLLGTIVGQLGTVLIYVGIALFLALGLDPLVSLLERKIPRPAAVASIVGVVLLIFAGILLAIVPVLIEQITNLIDNWEQMVNDIMNSTLFHTLSDLLGDSFDDPMGEVFTFLKDPTNLSQIGNGVLSFSSGLAATFTGITIVLILTLYFMASLRNMKSLAARFVPAYRRDGFRDILEDVCGAVGRYVIGQVSLALINGILSLIMLSIISAPLPALLALIAFLGSLIPMVGTLTGSIINSLVCLIAGPTTAIIAFIYYLVYMQIEAYILNPRIMSRAVSVPGSIVTIAAVGGAALGGVLGALVAVPVAASIIIIVQKVLFPAQDTKKKPPTAQGEDLVVVS